MFVLIIDSQNSNKMAEPENAKTWKYQIKILVKKMPNFKNKYQDC